MDEPTNHVAEAERFLGIRVKGNDADYVMMQVIVNTIGAQVHATLALVEQQRIANRISVASGNFSKADARDLGVA